MLTAMLWRADIPNTNGVHGIAIASDMGKGFTSSGREKAQDSGHFRE